MPSLLLFVVGLAFGSFISALTYRYPKGISIAKGRSFCPKCKNKIAWYDNIPLVSFLLLGGKCRSCHKPISWRYPLTELLVAIGFVFIGFNFYWLLVFTLLSAIFVIDLEHQLIPDSFVFFGIALVFCFLVLTNKPFFPPLLSGFTAAFLLLSIHLVTKGRGMGLGDVKFAVLGGLIAGLELMPVWLFLSFLTGAVAGIILVLTRVSRLKDKIAFGPFLILGLLIALLWGEKIMLVLGLP